MFFQFFVNPSRFILSFFPSFFLIKFETVSSFHAIRVAIDEAMEATKLGEKRVILFNFTGHGHFDLPAYNAYNSGVLTNNDFPVHSR